MSVARLAHMKKFLMATAEMVVDEAKSLDERWADFIGNFCPTHPNQRGCDVASLQAVRFMVRLSR